MTPALGKGRALMSYFMLEIGSKQHEQLSFYTLQIGLATGYPSQNVTTTYYCLINMYDIIVYEYKII